MKIGRWIAVAVIAAALRLPQLAIRPMHGDEAVMAMKAGALAWGGEGSAYDPTGYHGTLLGWLVQPVLRLSGATSLADTDERHFRLVTAVCGILLCLTPMLLADGLGMAGAQIAGLLLAVSPAFVYWSRFYIQEVPLVLATALMLGCGWRFARSKKNGWLWGAAVSAGLMLSLKETAWLSLIAGGIGLATVRPARQWMIRNRRQLFMPAMVALAIPALLLGPSALIAPLHYASLGLTGGDHAHPWYWYFTDPENPLKLVTEGIPLMLALVVPANLARQVWIFPCSHALAKFAGVFMAALAVEYSALPYKTPWCILNFLYPGMLLAGIGYVELVADRIRWPRTRGGRAHPAWLNAVFLAALALVLFAASLIYSIFQASDRRNPFVYAQPVEDARRLRNLVRRISRVHPMGREMVVAVVADNPWPLPWELRGFPNVGYWTPGDPDARRGFKMAAVRISPAKPGGTGMMFGVRPGEILAVEADRRLLDGALRSR